LRAQVGSAPTIEELETILKSQIFKLITVTHVDTSTGVLTDLKAISAAVRQIQPNALLIVDGVCAAAGEECRATEWDLDVVLTGSQKCIGVPAGLSILIVRPRALAVSDKPNKPRKSYYADWSRWIPIMKNYLERKPCYFATPPVNHLYALRVACNILLANGGMEARFNEHSLMSKGIKEAIGVMGLRQVPAEGCQATTMTCVYFPEGIEGPDLLRKVTEAGVTLAGGLHKDIKTKYFRIGHMGPSSRRQDHAIAVIEALESSFISLGRQLKKGEAVASLKSVIGHLPMDK
jgi:alanine-glyoxylate transaminase/serine-glyoxylate transaminase/serine-pyruvate transaminase